jgi:hypothetical protein
VCRLRAYTVPRGGETRIAAAAPTLLHMRDVLDFEDQGFRRGPRAAEAERLYHLLSVLDRTECPPPETEAWLRVYATCWLHLDGERDFAPELVRWRSKLQRIADLRVALSTCALPADRERLTADLASLIGPVA